MYFPSVFYTNGAFLYILFTPYLLHLIMKVIIDMEIFLILFLCLIEWIFIKQSILNGWKFPIFGHYKTMRKRIIMYVFNWHVANVSVGEIPASKTEGSKHI